MGLEDGVDTSEPVTEVASTSGTEVASTSGSSGLNSVFYILFAEAIFTTWTCQVTDIPEYTSLK
jgi:hypothetical protein